MTKNRKSDYFVSQKGQTVIITGANSGIGFEAARVMAKNGAKLIMAVRNKEKGEEAAETIRKELPEADVQVMILDLSDLQSVESFASRFKADNKVLHVLLNNAGVMVPPYTKTKDGFELQFGVNHLGHFALTALLFDVLKKSPGARIVNVSSIAHKRAKIRFDDLQWEKSYNKVKAYGQSKLANLLFTFELAKRIEEADLPVTVAAAHPGVSQTNLMRYLGIFKGLMKLFTQPAERGALPLLHASLDEDVKNGDYYGPDGMFDMKGYPAKANSSAAARDEDSAQKLWKVSENLVGRKFEV